MTGALRRPHHHIAAILAAFILISAAAALQMKPVAGPISSPVTARRLIGSSPPTCRWSCGVCRPCKAVRITVHPGISLPLDYYPEAWRCYCRHKFFMP